jgi:hypothetical protein
VRTKTVLATAVAVALFAAGCGGRGDSPGREEQQPAPAQASSADFGDLQGVCRPGTASGTPAQGVTADSVKLGVFSDVGFSKNTEYLGAAKVFTSWCNDLGGVNGRKLVANIRDSKLVEVRQRMIESCREDFAVVGGSSALDGTGVKERLSCLLPAFPAQVSQVGNLGSDLQVAALGGASYNRYAGYFSWLVKDAYPGSAGAVGIISGDSPITKVIAEQTKESLTGAGATVSYADLYPAQGVSDWTPYAQAIKSKGVKGLVFLGDFASLAKLNQVLTTIGYKLDWIDANNNAYGPAFIQLAGNSLGFQNNLADLSGAYPLEKAADNPATKKILDLYAKYAPDAKVTLPALRSFSAWLLFTKSAVACGDNLTRKCVYETAMKQTAWTGGGIHAPVDMSQQDGPIKCFNVEKATPAGWQPADFKPDNGAYRCDAPAYKYTASYGKPLTLADVGKSMNDVQ